MLESVVPFHFLSFPLCYIISLYAIPFVSIQVHDNGATHPINLLSFSPILRQIHLYSDGGFDISKDNHNYLVTCARLREKSQNRLVPSTKTSFSPLSTSDRVAEEERNSSLPLPPRAGVISSMPFFPPSRSRNSGTSASSSSTTTTQSQIPAQLEYNRRNELNPVVSLSDAQASKLNKSFQLPLQRQTSNNQASSSINQRRQQQLHPERQQASFTFDQFLSPQKVSSHCILLL